MYCSYQTAVSLVKMALHIFLIKTIYRDRQNTKNFYKSYHNSHKDFLDNYFPCKSSSQLNFDKIYCSCSSKCSLKSKFPKKVFIYISGNLIKKSRKRTVDAYCL